MGKGKRKKGPKYQRAHRDCYDARPISARLAEDFAHGMARSRNYYGTPAGTRRKRG